MGFKGTVVEKEKYPTPENCILELVNRHLKVGHVGARPEVMGDKLICKL